jgi:hypothetical protein
MIDIDLIARLETEATPAPWYVGRFDDEYFMSAITVEAYIDREGRPSREVVAATLIQQPAYVVPNDNRFCENAELIAEMRNALSELIRLARLGQLLEQGER